MPHATWVLVTACYKQSSPKHVGKQFPTLIFPGNSQTAISVSLSFWVLGTACYVEVCQGKLFSYRIQAYKSLRNYLSQALRIITIRGTTSDLVMIAVLMITSHKKPGTLVDGVLYWNAICTTPTSWILGFDIASEKFDIFPPPDGTNKGFDLELRMIGGSLSICLGEQGNGGEKEG
ncbi:hypothetical protein PTKIN_Ptkin06aG0177300 [Pterospermum kingtungense]